MGYGPSDASGYESTLNTYACFPVLDAQGRPVPDHGLEFVMSYWISDPTRDGGQALDAKAQKFVNAVVGYLMSKYH